MSFLEVFWEVGLWWVEDDAGDAEKGTIGGMSVSSDGLDAATGICIDTPSQFQNRSIISCSLFCLDFYQRISTARLKARFPLPVGII